MVGIGRSCKRSMSGTCLARWASAACPDRPSNMAGTSAPALKCDPLAFNNRARNGAAAIWSMTSPNSSSISHVNRLSGGLEIVTTPRASSISNVTPAIFFSVQCVLRGVSVSIQGELLFWLEDVPLHPGADQLGDRCVRIFLNEMRPGDRCFGLIFPASAILTERSGKNRTGIRIDEQFRDLIFRHPACVRVDDRFDVRRFTCDWNLPRPCEGRPAIFPVEERLAVRRHLCLR